MRSPLRTRATLAGFATLLALGPCPRLASAATCDDIAERGRLNVLTINLLFAEIETRDERLRQISAFAAANQVDVILLQEVVAGFLVRTENSAADLQEILSVEQGLDFELRTAFEAGQPDILAVANATLSRCAVLRAETAPLPAASELTIEGQVVPIPRNALMTLLELPGLGRASVYNTHLCAGCAPSERTSQIEAILGLIGQMQLIQPPDRLSLLGGDFDLDPLASPEDRADYDRILAAGFLDAYATAVAVPLEAICANPQVPDEHCTIGVSPLSNRIELSRDLAFSADLPIVEDVDLDLPLSLEVPLTEAPSAQRIDYIFARNVPSSISARVVFNPLIDPAQPAVSDHAGVLASFMLPPP
jgi:maltose 6'-phosphate phosphatase